MSLMCSFRDCADEVVCGLWHRVTGDQINVCRQHFKVMKGKPYRGKPRIETEAQP